MKRYMIPLTVSLSGIAAYLIYRYWKRYDSKPLPVDPSALETKDPPVITVTPTITIIGEGELIPYIKLKFKSWLYRVKVRDSKDETPIVGSHYIIAFDRIIAPVHGVEKIIYISLNDRDFPLDYPLYADSEKKIPSIMIRPTTLCGRVHAKSLTRLYQIVLRKDPVIYFDDSSYDLIHIDTLCQYIYTAMKSPYVNLDFQVGSGELSSEEEIFKILLPMVNHPCELKSSGRHGKKDPQVNLDLAKLFMVSVTTGITRSLKDGLSVEKIRAIRNRFTEG